MEPQKRSLKKAVPRHIPQVVVPVPMAEARDFVRAALAGTSIVDPFASYLSGWTFFAPYIRFSLVDDSHTRVELDVVGRVRGAETLLFAQRRGEIDRFFVAIQDELDRRNRWVPPLSATDAIGGAD